MTNENFENNLGKIASFIASADALARDFDNLIRKLEQRINEIEKKQSERFPMLVERLDELERLHAGRPAHYLDKVQYKTHD